MQHRRQAQRSKTFLDGPVVFNHPFLEAKEGIIPLDLAIRLRKIESERNPRQGRVAQLSVGA